MDEADKGRLMTMIGVSGWGFLLVPGHLGCPRQNPESRKMVVCVYTWFNARDEHNYFKSSYTATVNYSV